MHKTLITSLSVALATTTPAEPIKSSWLTKPSGQYARIYPTTTEETANTPTTSWIHPNGGTSQPIPTYAGVHEVSITSTDLYIRTTGLPFHTMGPWYGETGNLFPHYPNNTAQIARFPLTPQISPIPKNLTTGGAIGYFIDGVAMFDSRDAFSYRNDLGIDGNPQSLPNRGDGVWNRDAFVNESVTFDAANAHQANGIHHYHANPPGLRHIVSDSVIYDSITNTYTETPSGKHSPILAWTFDGLPLYGPYGYSDPLNPNSPITRMISGYQKRNGTNGSTDLTTTGRTSLPLWITRNETNRTNPLATNQYGPAVNSTSGGETFILGHYLEDYAYKGDLGLTLGTDFDLNEYNVRWCITPEFPNGTWAYFSCIDVDGTPVFPYNISRYYFGTLQGTNNATLPATREVIFQGGPEANHTFIHHDHHHDHTNQITLKWSGPEGGTYRIDQSTNLFDWKIFNDSAKNDSGSIGSQIEFDLTSLKKFYRSTITSLEPFDDNGFDYTPPTTPTFTARFENLPNLTDIDTITIGGTTATITGINHTTGLIDLTFPTDTLAPADYNAILTTVGATTINSTNAYTVAANRNILLIIVDDWGTDSSPLHQDPTQNPNATFPSMPNLQTLADRGITFTNAYAHPICSPTRATIITGRHAFRHGVGDPTSSLLPTSELTLPEIFTAQNSPYQLGSFGKWHLGGGNNGPSIRGGWPEFRGTLSGGVGNYYDWDKTINGTTTSGTTTYPTTDQVNEAENFITTQDANNKPWFVWLAFNAPHTPFHNPPASLTTYPTYPTNAAGNVTGANRRFAYEAALQAIDTEIGRLLQSVDLNSTNIILIGDNGTPGQVAQEPFDTDHSKGSLYRGGVHVPLVIAGPDITLSGTSTRHVHAVDIFSTILELAKINVTTSTTSVDTIDSKSLLPILKGADSASRTIVSERFGSNTSPNGRTIISANHPNYKLIIFGDPTSTTDTSTYELYNISIDSNEQTPLALPPTTTDPHYTAYQALIAIDNSLVPSS